jgi:hypothetical protein
MLRACKSSPQYNGGCCGEKRLRSPPLARVMWPSLRIPPGYAEEGASISINALERTGHSGRCVAWGSQYIVARRSPRALI